MDNPERIRLISRIVHNAADLLTATKGWAGHCWRRRAMVENTMILSVEAGDDVGALLAALKEERGEMVADVEGEGCAWDATIADHVPQILRYAASLLSATSAGGRRMSRRSLTEVSLILAVEAGDDVEAWLAEIRDQRS